MPAIATRQVVPIKRYRSRPPCRQRTTSSANASPAPELSFTPATVPSAASAAVVAGSTVSLTVLGML